MNKTLKKLYYNTETGFAGVESLFKKAKLVHPLITRSNVEKWLAKQPTYSLHKPARRQYSRNRVLVSGIDDQWQADLVDLQSLSKFNDGFKYLLNAIDIFSKHAWSVPLKDKKSATIISAFETIFKTGRQPGKLQTDAGTEFLNKDVQKYLKANFVDFFTTKSEMKASVVERFNRTLKERMWRIFTKQNTYRYIDFLDALMKNYNSSYHRTIKMAPVQVSKTNERDILNSVFRVNKPKNIKFKFDIGDKVRISKIKRHFEKGYWPNWSEEYFIIDFRAERIPPVYTLKDQMGEKLEGIFYESELQKIDPKGQEVFVVEKILKTRKIGSKTRYFVKWRGYPDKFNSWVSDIQLL